MRKTPFEIFLQTKIIERYRYPLSPRYSQTSCRVNYGTKSVSESFEYSLFMAATPSIISSCAISICVNVRIHYGDTNLDLIIFFLYYLIKTTKLETVSVKMVILYEFL